MLDLPHPTIQTLRRTLGVGVNKVGEQNALITVKIKGKNEVWVECVNGLAMAPS